MRNRGKKPKDRPPPPGPHWFQRADRSKPPYSVDKDASDVINVEIRGDVVILVVS